MPVRATECTRCGLALSGSPVEAKSFPFCSPRCKLVDLSKWLSGSYRIPGEPVDLEGPGVLRTLGERDDDEGSPSA